MSRSLPIPPGYTGNAGLVINEGQHRFLVALHRATPGIPKHINSATRTAERQAGALATKRKLGDDLTKLYASNADIARALLAVPNTTPAMAAVLRHYMAQGRYLSRHMRGDALDLRTRNWTAAQRDAVAAAARSLGARVVIESTPPHMHLERLGAAGALDTVYSLVPGRRRRRRPRVVRVGGYRLGTERQVALGAAATVAGLLLVVAAVRAARD